MSSQKEKKKEKESKAVIGLASDLVAASQEILYLRAKLSQQYANLETMFKLGYSKGVLQSDVSPDFLHNEILFLINDV